MVCEYCKKDIDGSMMAIRSTTIEVEGDIVINEDGQHEEYVYVCDNCGLEIDYFIKHELCERINKKSAYSAESM